MGLMVAAEVRRRIPVVDGVKIRLVTSAATHSRPFHPLTDSPSDSPHDKWLRDIRGAIDGAWRVFTHARPLCQC